ncbi:MAG: hypothetical protein PHY43_04975 [Verrucomicrobiales bacterium]|nr:hypothetical protein [Verrucomicrobiales bacterium]
MARKLPEVAACVDEELHRMLSLPTPPPRHTDEFGTPLPGSSLILDHPDLPNYRRCSDIRRRGADDPALGYLNRVVAFLDSHPTASQMWIVCLCTQKECYEISYFAQEKAMLLSIQDLRYAHDSSA